MSEMRLLGEIHSLPKPRRSERVVGQSNATGKMNCPLRFGVFGVCFVLVYTPAAWELVLNMG